MWTMTLRRFVTGSPLVSQARRSLPLRRRSTPSARRRPATGGLRRGEPRRRPPVAGLLRAEGVDRRRRGKDRRAREESGELSFWAGVLTPRHLSLKPARKQACLPVIDQ